MLGKTASLKLQTPEGVSFHLPLAGPVSRGLALIVDFLVLMTIFLVVVIGFNVFSGIVTSVPVIGRVLGDFGMGLLIVFSFLLVMLYSIILEWLWHGQTIGKRLLSLRVVDERGLNLTLGQVTIRNLFRLIDILPSMFYFVAAMSSALSKRCQRVGDIAAGTIVVREVVLAQPEVDEYLHQFENSFVREPRLEAQLRQNTGPDEARIALDAVLRRNQLGEQKRLVVFGKLADHFRNIVEFSDHVTIGLSDEQFVRNVVDTLFRRRINHS